MARRQYGLSSGIDQCRNGHNTAAKRSAALQRPITGMQARAEAGSLLTPRVEGVALNHQRSKNSAASPWLIRFS